MYIWLFCRSDGAGRAITLNVRGLTRSVSARIVPPLPAPSRPSNMTMTRRPFSFTYSCRWHSCTCSLPSSFSYFARFIARPPLGDELGQTFHLCLRQQIVTNFSDIVEPSCFRDEVELHLGFAGRFHDRQQRRKPLRTHPS